ncbi:MAG: hypothetical protein A2010_09150 [Nitrospirae bacterium GWD2_57_9]|nr:MAG: hypothetical protein A2010_09150 [Nitrospirae bacterium GWD2_57_9]
MAGTAAAVAAARCKVRTLLVEQAGYLGGAGYAGMFQYVCGLYVNSGEVPAETLNPGLPREIAGLLTVKTGQSVKRIGQVHVLPYTPEDLRSVLSSLTAAEPHLTVLSGNAAGGVRIENGKITSIELVQGGRKESVTSAMIVDCTGNGNIASAAGAPYELSPLPKRQLAGFSIRIQGLHDADEWLAVKVPYHLSKAVEQGLFAPSARFTNFCLGDTEGEGFCKISIEAEEGPERDDQARKNAEAIHAYLVSVLPAFKDSSIAGLSLKVLDREGRRVLGEYTLTAEDVVTGRKFPDGVVKNSWPIELWERERGTVYRYVPRGDHYEIPFRCLKVKGIDNLLTAGRCISATREALGSARVMGTCMALGEQAGKAAAYRVKNGKYPENIKDY